MSWRERLGPSIPTRLAARRQERTFRARVERAFEPDPAAIDRVRAAILGEEQLPVRPLPLRRRPVTGLVRLGLPVAAAFVLVVAAGLLAFGGPGGVPTGSPPVDQAALLATDLARSAVRFHDATVAIGTGDIATIDATLGAYRAGLLALEPELGRPGADDVRAASDLQAQSAQLADLEGSVPASELNLYHDVLADLDRIIGALPGGTDPGNTDHPTPSDHPGNTDHPTPSDHPGQTDHPGNTDHPTPSNHPGNTDHPTPSNHPGNTDHPTPSTHPGNTTHPTPHPKSSGNTAGSVVIAAAMTGGGD